MNSTGPRSVLIKSLEFFFLFDKLTPAISELSIQTKFDGNSAFYLSRTSPFRFIFAIYEPINIRTTTRYNH